MITRKPWTDDMAGKLTHPAGAACMPYLEREVRAGIAKLWHCQDGADEAWIISRLDSNPAELVICYAEGRGLHRFAPEFIAAARAAGVPLRMHTTNEFMVRLARRWGFQLAEYVLRAA